MLQRPAPSDPLDRVFAALADPARRAMIERLGRGPASATELGAPFAMSLSAVVQHLQVLEASGLVSSRKAGRVRTFTLDTAAIEAARRWFEERKRAWEHDLDLLEALILEDGPS